MEPQRILTFLISLFFDIKNGDYKNNHSDNHNDTKSNKTHKRGLGLFNKGNFGNNYGDKINDQKHKKIVNKHKQSNKTHKRGFGNGNKRYFLNHHSDKINYQEYEKIMNIYNHNYNYNIQGWIKIVVLRDPLRRLVSGYLNKCYPTKTKYCNFVLDYQSVRVKNNISMDINDNYNITTINDKVRKIKGKFKNINGSNNKSKRKSKSMIKLDDVVDALYYKFVINPSSKILIDDHLAPQSTHSNINFFISQFDYIIILDKETFGINMYQILIELKSKNILKHSNDFDFYWKNKFGVDAFNVTLDKNGSIVPIVKKQKFTGHTTTSSSVQELNFLRKLFNNTQTLEKALEIFKYEYLFLPFEYPPKWIYNL